jgi:hypothetical protein
VKLPEQPKPGFFRPQLTRTRIILAFAVAIVADGLQLLLNVVGWAGLDQAIDCVAMALTMCLLGFHVLLLPTFVIELVPLLEDFPTWTACVAAVVALRKRGGNSSRLPPPDKPTIDVP